MSVGTTIDIIWMMMEAEMYGMTPMAKIDRRDSAPPENMFTIPRMVLERSPKKRATSAGFTPGTGMKVPIRKKKRSEEHTSEFQSPCNLVCRLLLEKKKNRKNQTN